MWMRVKGWEEGVYWIGGERERGDMCLLFTMVHTIQTGSDHLARNLMFPRLL